VTKTTAIDGNISISIIYSVDLSGKKNLLDSGTQLDPVRILKKSSRHFTSLCFHLTQQTIRQHNVYCKEHQQLHVSATLIPPSSCTNQIKNCKHTASKRSTSISPYILHSHVNIFYFLFYSPVIVINIAEA